MHTVSSGEVQTRYGEFVETVQDDVVCVTRDGQPLYWAVADQLLRAPDPGILIGRLLLLHGQLNPQTGPGQGDSLGKVLGTLDSNIDAQDLDEEAVMAIVHEHRV